MSAKAWQRRKTSGARRCSLYGHSFRDLTSARARVAYLWCRRCGYQTPGMKGMYKSFGA